MSTTPGDTTAPAQAASTDSEARLRADIAALVSQFRSDAERNKPYCVPGPDGDEARAERGTLLDVANRIERVTQAGR